VQYISSYSSPLGGITLASDGSALTGLWFDGQKYFAATLPREHQAKEVPLFGEVKSWLDSYFSGDRPEINFPLAPQGTPFRKMIWQMLIEIPYGKTLTYGQLAAAAAASMGLPGMAAQAVGGAVGHNPISLVIPCHRVVGTNGSLTGYAGGVDKKLRLLELEGADISQLFMPQK